MESLEARLDGALAGEDWGVCRERTPPEVGAQAPHPESECAPAPNKLNDNNMRYHCF